MELRKFEELWKKWSQEWLETTVIQLEDSNKINVSEICHLDADCFETIYHNYELIKQLTKNSYFKDPSKKLNRYKRAAVLVYAIEKSEPLKYKTECGYEYLFLKQRLAFFVAIGSILQDYPQSNVEELSKNNTLFDFSSIWKDREPTDDDFITSVYKDIFFSSAYKNYNVLTMANVFSLIIEKCSVLPCLQQDN